MRCAMYVGTKVAAKSLHALENPGLYEAPVGSAEHTAMTRDLEQEAQLLATLRHPM